MPDITQRILSVSVRNLVEYVLRSGDLISEIQILDRDRGLKGIRAHQQLQKSMPDGYRSEVALSLEILRNRLSFRVQGRADGIYESEGQVYIDEIKSTSKDPSAFEGTENPIHWGQAKAYAYILGKTEQLPEIGIQLRYINPDSKAVREYRRIIPMAELECFFMDLLDRWEAWALRLLDWQNQRNHQIESLDFPQPSYRRGQKEMALAVYRAIEKQRQLVVEAPTGIGKTLAALFPAIKAMGRSMADRLFYLTAKTTGQTVAQTAIDQLRDAGLSLKSTIITAKEKVCLMPDAACNGDECPYARGYYDRINDAMTVLFEQDSYTRETIKAAAETYMLCPFELSLELALITDCVICDYNYAFDPRVSLKRFFGEEREKSDYVFLIDEANNLVDRSREMFSASLSKQAVLEMRRHVKQAAKAIYTSLGRINRGLLEIRKEFDRKGRAFARDEYPEKLEDQLRKFVRTTEQWFRQPQQFSHLKELLALYFSIKWFLKVSEKREEGYALLVDMQDKDLVLKLYCLDPANQLTQAFTLCRSAVFFSATLSPISYFKRILGCDPNGWEMRLPSPFPPENLSLPLMNRISTRYQDRNNNRQVIARSIQTLVSHQAGNYLVFLPSYHYMEIIAAEYKKCNDSLPVIIQSSRMTESERKLFLDQFSASNPAQGQTMIGFAVLGGIFAEGIDLVGDRLTGVVVVGVGLPGISLEREMIKTHFDNSGGNGFDFAYLYPGLTRVFQAAGRLIRSDTDRGVLLLIGQRFSSLPYRNLLPPHWMTKPIADETALKDFLRIRLKDRI